MDENKAIEPSAIAPIEELTPALTIEEDSEARFAKLEEEKENYRKAYLKEKGKNKEVLTAEGDESMEDVARRVLAESRLAEIAREQDAIITKALKENKELKLAQKNKTGVPTAVGTHSEGIAVKDTSVTQDQMAAFKAKGWTDKDIERYKKNLQKNIR